MRFKIKRPQKTWSFNFKFEKKKTMKELNKANEFVIIIIIMMIMARTVRTTTIYIEKVYKIEIKKEKIQCFSYLVVLFLNIVGSRRHVSTVSGPVGVHEIARLGEKLVGVRAEVVALGLNEIGRQSFASIAVIER